MLYIRNYVLKRFLSTRYRIPLPLRLRILVTVVCATDFGSGMQLGSGVLEVPVSIKITQDSNIAYFVSSFANP